MNTTKRLMHSTLIAACVVGGAAPAARAAEPSPPTDQGSLWQAQSPADALIAGLAACAENQRCSAILAQLAASCAASPACTAAVDQFLAANPVIAQKVREAAPVLGNWIKNSVDP